MDMAQIQTFLVDNIGTLAVKVAAAIAFWIIGRWIIGKVVGLVRAAMNRNKLDPTLTKYLGSVIAVLLNIALVMGILGYFGVETTSFAALLAGAGVAIGAAWSGLLGNFAAGAFMLVFRPFKAGDFVTVNGVTGTVTELGLFATTLVTPDNVVTIIGNGKVFSENISNLSATAARRVDRTAQLNGSVNLDEAIAKLTAAITAIPNVVADPKPEVRVLDINLMGPVLAVRPHTHNDHYWQVYFDTNEAILRTARDAGWPAPMPAQTVNMNRT